MINSSPPAIGIWEAMEKLNTLVDESDPDVRPYPHPIPPRHKLFSSLISTTIFIVH